MMINGNYGAINNFYKTTNTTNTPTTQKESEKTGNDPIKLEGWTIYDPNDKNQLSPKEWAEKYKREVEASKPKKQSVDRSEVDRLANEYVNTWIKEGTRFGTVGYGVYDENGNKVKQTLTQMNATMVAFFRYTQPLAETRINNLLSDNGITLDEDEEVKMFVDGKLHVTVSGLADTEKAKQIEDLLNDPNAHWGRQLNALTRKYSSEYKSLEPELGRLMGQKNTVEDELRYLSGGTISLSDLSLENGEIVGLTPELEELYNGTKEGLSEKDKLAWEGGAKMIKKLLSIGLDNIPDITDEITLKGGKLSIDDYVDPYLV